MGRGAARFHGAGAISEAGGLMNWPEHLPAGSLPQFEAARHTQPSSSFK